MRRRTDLWDAFATGRAPACASTISRWTVFEPTSSTPSRIPTGYPSTKLGGMTIPGVREYTVRRARTSDVPAIRTLIEPLVAERILLGKERVVFYEAVQEFRVAETPDGTLIGCGALHVMWEDLGEVRTLAVARDWLGNGVGYAILERLESDARELGLTRLFCLTFEVGFFTRNGYRSEERRVGEECRVR